MIWAIARIGAEIETKLAKVGDSVYLPTFDDLETAIGFPITHPGMLARWCGYRYLARPFSQGYVPGFDGWKEVAESAALCRAEQHVVLATGLQQIGAKNQTELRAVVLKEFKFDTPTKRATIYERLRKRVPGLRSNQLYNYLGALADAGWLVGSLMRGGNGFRRTTPEERNAKREAAESKRIAKHTRALAIAATNELVQQFAARFALALTTVEIGEGPGVWL